MNKLSFMNNRKPWLMSMIEKTTPEDIIVAIKKSSYDGADSLAIHLCNLERQYRTEKTLREIFSYASDMPIYLPHYRNRQSVGMTDDELINDQIIALKAGATLIDIMSDTYDAGAELQFSRDATAVKKQKGVIAHIHDLGGEVLMSAHALRFLPKDKVLDILLAQQDRGADVAKLVTWASDEHEMIENLETMVYVKENLDIPFVFLCSGQYSKLQRTIGHSLGNFMIFCMQDYYEPASREQPLLRSMKVALANMDLTPYRDGYPETPAYVCKNGR